MIDACVAQVRLYGACMKRTNTISSIVMITACALGAACEQKSTKPAPTKTESAAKSAGESAGKAAAEGAKAGAEASKAASEAAKDIPKEE